MESECTFEALPFLFPERQRASLVAWREEAVKRERKHASRRQQQLLDLQHYVADRLMQLRERQQPSAHNTLTHSSSGHRTTPTTLTVSDEGGPIKKFNRTPSLESPLKEHESVYSLEVARDRADKGPTADHSGGGLSVKNSDCPPPGDVYVKVTALGRGFLTRRLLQSAKISSLIQTIKDGGKVLAGISEPASDQDKALCDRVHTQLQLARMTLLDILELPVGEKMAYIAHSRLLREQKMGRKRVLMGKVASHGRLSLATQRAIERRQKSSATISASQPRKQVHKPASLQERSKLQQDRPGRVRGPRLDPVPHSKVPSQTLRPPTVAVQDKIKARQNKTTAPLRVLGRNAPRDRASQSEHDSKLGQVKSGHQRQTGRHRPRTQPLPTHLPEQMTKKSKTRTIPSQ